MKFGNFSRNVSIHVLDFFWQNLTCFLQSQHFFTNRYYFLYVLCWENEYILSNISAEGPECLKKTYIHFSNNIFLIGTVIINLVNYIWGIRFNHKNNDRLEMR